MLRYYNPLAKGGVGRMDNPHMGPKMTSHMVDGVRVPISRIISVEKKRKFQEYVEKK